MKQTRHNKAMKSTNYKIAFRSSRHSIVRDLWRRYARKMHNLTSSEIEGLELGDAQYYGYHWCQSSSVPTLVILIVPANSKPQELVFSWATNMRVELNYKNHVGPLLTWDVTMKKEIDVWYVDIDIPNHGSIEFSCNSISIRT